jgi:tRNA(Ile2) C34 agmatinyltransferase TiaS
MRVYVGFDDTDTRDADRGTGKLARWFERELPEGCQVWGVVRQQLFVHDQIPYTSHNSSACVVVSVPYPCPLNTLVERAVGHVERYAIPGSDPGVCVACEGDPSLPELVDFATACTRKVVSQKEALRASSHVHLSGHGGTNDGIIGAAAAVGLTASGWCGRFIEYGRLRDLPNILKVSDLAQKSIQVVSLDRDARVPAPEDLVLTKGWIRPRLWGQRPVLVLKYTDEGIWESLGEKRHMQAPMADQPARLAY